MSEATHTSQVNSGNATDEMSLSDQVSTQSATDDLGSKHPIAKIAEDYQFAIRDILQTVKIVMPHLASWQSNQIKEHETRLAQFISQGERDGDQVQIAFESTRELADISATIRSLDELKSSKAIQVLARSLFMQIFSEFDAFMGDLVKAIYIKNQESMKGISREITLRELLEYASIEEVKMAMLDKEVDTFRRESYAEQFSNLEKKFRIELKKFSEYPYFIELSQRRNIFTHNDGVVNKQYLSVCEKEGWRFSKKPVPGDTLHVSVEYIGRALTVMSKIGYMLAHTLWIKVFPQECEVAHESMNDRIYQCLIHKHWRLAAELGSFALTDPMKKGVKEITLRIRTINTAIGFKFCKNDKKAEQLLKSLDWTASYRDFKLAIHILQEEYDEAVALMLNIGRSGELLVQESYFTWPLFHQFRERPEFYATYEKIYGEPYLTQVPSDGKNTNVPLTRMEVPAKENFKAKGANPVS